MISYSADFAESRDGYFDIIYQASLLIGRTTSTV